MKRLLPNPEEFMICGKAGKPKLVLKDYMTLLIQEQ